MKKYRALFFAILLAAAYPASAGEWDIETWFDTTSEAKACRAVKKLIYNYEHKEIKETKECECEEHKDGSWTCSVEYYYERVTD